MVARCSIPKPDQMTYLVQCKYRDGLYWAERDAGDTDRATTITHIRNGNLPNVQLVLECNPVERICRDVTDDLLLEAEQSRERDEVADFRKMLQDYKNDHDRELRVHGW